MVILSEKDMQCACLPVVSYSHSRRLRTGVALIVMAAAVLVVGSADVMVPQVAEAFATGRTLYVSPTGADGNLGTVAAPWRSMSHVSRVVLPGDTVVFADGVYEEKVLTRFTNGGTADRPIVLRAANRWKAAIHYVGDLNSARLLIDKPYLIIKDLDIYATQWTSVANMSDVLVSFGSGGDYGQVIGNRIHRVYGDALKLTRVTGAVLADNVVYDTFHKGIEMINVANVTVRNNSVYGIGRVGVVAKGGARNVRFLNNVVGAPRLNVDGFVAYALGGVTGSASTYDIHGYEGYRLVAVNNIAYSATVNAVIGTGLLFQGCFECGAFNNIIAGVKVPLATADGGDPRGAGGTAWTAYTVNPAFVNNIVAECLAPPSLYAGTLKGVWNHDYNLYYNCPKVVDQQHGVGDPLFVKKYVDWHLTSRSPAVNAGAPLTTYSAFSDASTPAMAPLDLRYDRSGVPRTGAWDLGVYNVSTS